MTPEFCVSCTVLDAPLTARVQMLDGGVRAEIYGGTRPHIGAVSIAGPEGTVTTTEFPTHRDGAVSGRWAEAMAGAGLRPAVVLAGIHYDNLPPDGIRQVLAASDHLLKGVLARLAATP
ncbi:MAG: hypothetical protein DBX59_01355 [Bacillota bacterium]|nr:MAG: hypothetical protein DBX59_01355 [Bacillota bacterium]